MIIYGVRPDAKALIKDVSVDKELKFRYQLRLDTVVVYTINYAVLGSWSIKMIAESMSNQSYRVVGEVWSQV